VATGDSSCGINADCCSNLCNVSTSMCVSCLPEFGTFCLQPFDCCSPLVCDSGTQTCVSCIPMNDPCSTSTDCCSGLVCPSGHCVIS
jgi:hypothetical protein